MAKLATAFAFVQFNITLTGAVDTALAGRAGTVALATCGLGSAFFTAVGVLVQGCGFGAEPFVAQALGAQQTARSPALAVARHLCILAV